MLAVVARCAQCVCYGRGKGCVGACSELRHGIRYMIDDRRVAMDGCNDNIGPQLAALSNA
jgi:hypothetical protein